LVILKGGPRSRSVYYEDDWDQQVRAAAACGRPVQYGKTDRQVTIGEVYVYLPKDAAALAECPATVWLYRA
jgi:hypothetical protein